MKKLIYTLNTICVAAILVSAVSIRSMENNTRKALMAEKWNKNNPNISFVNHLIDLPSDPLRQITHFLVIQKYDHAKSLINLAGSIINNNYDYYASLQDNIPDMLDWLTDYSERQKNNPIRLFETSIKQYMILRSTCKYFNSVLTVETIGNLYAYYDQETKNNLWQEIKETKYEPSINKKTPLSILICSTINNYNNSWLSTAIYNNNLQDAALSLKYYANPNAKHIHTDTWNGKTETHATPFFFNAKTVEMVQLLIAYGLNIHETGSEFTPNVLWETISNGSLPELTQFYLQQKIDPTKIRSCDKRCLLHEIAKHGSKYDTDEFLEKTILILNAMPNMINMPDKCGQTPLDIALESLAKAKKLAADEPSWFKGGDEVYEKLIALFRKCHAKTAQELFKKELFDEESCTIS